jgi:hypothetical protein
LLGGSLGTVMAASVVWLVLTLAALVRAAGGSIPHSLELACAAVAAPVAIVAAGHTIAAYWRGPTIVSFAPVHSEVCTPDEAAYVRLASQLRGTMGGAGFLHPLRLFLPAVAWTAAAAEGVALAASGIHSTVFAALSLVGVGASAAAILFPARAYFYREATGGTAILSPPSVARRLKRRAAAAQEREARLAGSGLRPPPHGLPTPAPGLQGAAAQREPS